ncbi:MAG: RNase adapter RapZ [Armatimonadetes bacterium]|nr:RNase adapter RapZ [Armatimonadota bacterium]
MNNKGKFVIISGLSGAGKSLAVNFFEDMNYFCADNLLPALLPQFIILCKRSEVKNVAIVIDVRGRKFFKELISGISNIHEEAFNSQILFLEAKDEILLRRFSETRRKHPLALKGRILEGIKLEKKQLEEIRSAADKIIDTSHLTPKHLKNEILLHFFNKKAEGININIVSFGFKYGIPLDADLVYDVRFLPNPFYEKRLQNLTGRHKKIKDYISKEKITQQFIKKLFDLHHFLIPNYVKEGKSNLTIAIGCTGGKHRSIFIAERLAHFFKKKHLKVTIEHRDLNK